MKYAAAHEADTQRLITPHGDLKLTRPSNGWLGPKSTHYPSWGFETNPTIEWVARAEVDSLPLMGI